MYVVLPEIAGNHLTAKMTRARKVFTFIHTFDSFEEKMDHLREAELFMDQFALADHKIKGMPTLLVNEDDCGINRVFVQAPGSKWVEVTEATAKEMSDISMGVFEGQTPDFIPTLGLSAELFGLKLGASFSS